MKLLLRLCAVVMVVVAATWAYRVNYATQEAMNRVADLGRAIAAEREALAVLEAEWAYLNRPDRLRALVAEDAETLGLVELTPAHFGEVAMIAYPPEPEAVAEAASGPPDGAEEDATGAASTVIAARPRPAAAAKPAHAAKREAAAAPPATPTHEPVRAAEPRRPRTLQDLVNAVAAGVKP